jgi:hypothetical protein
MKLTFTVTMEIDDAEVEKNNTRRTRQGRQVLLPLDIARDALDQGCRHNFHIASHRIEEVDMGMARAPLPNDNLLSFERFTKTNVARCEAHAQAITAWGPDQWSNAMAGETGEACNLTKKMSRIWPANQFKQSWNKPEDQRMDTLVQKLKREIGDVVIYADLLAVRVNLTLEDCVRTSFNEKSAELGSAHLL